ncbi:MAG: O-antigen ligase family protein [Acidobacteria bacterium]|nr:O-antigen ligase family protein [Acidobacteriota bacterium]
MFAKITSAVLLLFLFSLGFMQPFMYLGSAKIQVSDGIFPVLFLLTAFGVAFSAYEFPKSRFVYVLLFFLAAMAFSALAADDWQSASLKLAGKTYLALIPLVTATIVRSADDLRRAVQISIGAAAVCIGVGLVSAFLFYADRDNWLLGYTLFHYGTLPPGNYPRISSTFLNANMLANYLSVAALIIIAGRREGIIGRVCAAVLLGGCAICAMLTFSPGIGGFFFAAGIWLFTEKKRRSAVLLISFATLFLLVAAVSPKPQSTPLFSVAVPFTELKLEPSARALTWIDAAKTFARNPVFGRGLGENTCLVRYDDLSGVDQTLTDAHNTFLNVSAESGIVGLAAVLLICGFLVRFVRTEDEPLKLLVIAFLSAFVYQGLTGSFEDARHLWALMGLILARERILSS